MIDWTPGLLKKIMALEAATLARANARTEK